MKYFLILVALLCFGCVADPLLPNNTENCKYIRHTIIESAIVPSTANVNQSIPIVVRYTVFDGCGGLNNIEETTDGNNKTLKVIAKYEGCACFQALQSLQTNYNITFATIGTKTIKFLQPDNSFLTYSINIQ